MKTENSIMKLGQLKEEITKATLPVSADLVMTLHQLFWKLTKEKFEVNFGGAAQISTIFYQ